MKYQFARKSGRCGAARAHDEGHRRAVGSARAWSPRSSATSAPALETLLIWRELAIEPEYLFAAWARSARSSGQAGQGGAPRRRVVFERMARAEAADWSRDRRLPADGSAGCGKGELEQGHPGRELGIILSGEGCSRSARSAIRSGPGQHRLSGGAAPPAPNTERSRSRRPGSSPRPGILRIFESKSGVPRFGI